MDSSHLQPPERLAGGAGGFRPLREWGRTMRQLPASKFVEIGLTGVGIVIDAVNLPPVLAAICSVILAMVVAVIRWALRMLKRARDDIRVGGGEAGD
jgi:hypothetical protein